MRCVVPGCKNDSKNNSKSNGVTFHQFPVEPALRKAWLAVLGIPEWQPKERSSVCSLHFLLDDLYTTANGLRKVRDGAVPMKTQDLDSKKEFDVPITNKVCRMCLIVSERVYSIEMCNLGEAFERLTGLFVNEESLPQNLCPICAMRLQNYNTFRERTWKANDIMLDLLKNNDHITENMLSCVSIEIPRLSKHFNSTHIEIQHSENEETQIQNAIETDKAVKDIDIKNEPDNAPDIFVDDFSAKSASCDVDYSEISENTNFTQEFDASDNDNDKDVTLPDFDSEDSIPLESTRKTKKKKKTVKRTKKESKVKTEKAPSEPKIDRRRKPFLNQDLNETLFTIIDLSLEEQIAEVLKRQETDNFKHAVFKCMECYKGFLDQDAYSSHMVRHTSACGEYKCEICKTHFKQSHALRKHITAHHLQRFSCNHCPYVTTHRQTARLHERWHKGTKYQCPHCDLEFLKFTTYMGHVRIKHPSDFVCELCGYSFVSAKGIELHKKLKHRGEDAAIPEDAPFCEPCNVRFVSSEAHHKHLSVSARHAGADREHNKPCRGRKGREQERDKQNSKETDSEEKGPLYPNQLRKVEGPISCEQCGMELEDSRAYHSHFRRMHPDKNRTNYPSMKSPCMCEVCGRIFQSYALLKDHTWVHTGERPFKCEQCGKSFRMKQRLVAHRRVHSAARASHSCAVCGKHFSTRSNRQRHMFIHTGLKPYKCEMCGKGFKHASEKRAHVTYVHLKKPWPKRARGKRPEGSPTQAGASEMDIQPVWPACDPKLTDINLMEDKPMYYR